MGMTIEDCILALTKERKTALHENKRAFDMAIDTMWKYQHITEIVEAWKADTDLDSYDCMADIEGVLNGNDDYEARLKADMVAMLDNIRAEIENDWQLKKYPSSPFSCGLRRALEIIDKYRAESEVEE